MPSETRPLRAASRPLGPPRRANAAATANQSLLWSAARERPRMATSSEGVSLAAIARVDGGIDRLCLAEPLAHRDDDLELPRRPPYGDPRQREDGLPGALGHRRRRRGSGMRGGDPHPQRRWQDPEAQRRVQSHGLAVDARGDRTVCVNLERGCGPLSPRPLEEAPTRHPARTATVIPSSSSSILGRVPEPTARPRR